MQAQDITELIIAESQYRGHSSEALGRGLIPFATLPQVKFIISLLHKCGCPKEREQRLWLTSQLVGRELRSSKDLSFHEASAIIEALLVGPDGKGDSGAEPCGWAREAIGQMLEGGKQYVKV